MSIRLGLSPSRRRKISDAPPPVVLFDVDDFPAGLELDFAQPSSVLRTGRTVTGVLDVSGNGRTMGVIGTPQYYEEDCAIHLAPGQALFRADDDFLKDGVAAVFAVFTLRTANNQIKPIFAKYNTTGNQCTLSVGLSSSQRPLLITSTDGTGNAGTSLNDPIPVNEPSYLSFFSNATAEEVQFIIDGQREFVSSGVPVPLLFDSSAGYGVNYVQGGAANGDFYLHYLRVYDDETVDSDLRARLDGFIANWYDDNMLYREPISITPPTISGTPNDGYVLTFTEGLALRFPSYTYQWTRDGVDIAGATKKTYLQTLADVGTVIGVYGAMYNEDGAVGYTITGSSCGAAFGTPPNATAPVITVAASLAGAGIHRQIMTCTPATIAAAHAVERTYQWFVDGKAVFGAYLPTYVVEHNDSGKPIYCEESITNVYGTSVSRTNTIISWTPQEDELRVWYDLNDYWSIRDNIRTVGDLQYIPELRTKGTEYLRITQVVPEKQPSYKNLEMNKLMATAIFDGVDDVFVMDRETNMVDKTLVFVATCGREITGYVLDEFGNPDFNTPIFGDLLDGAIVSHSTANVSIRVDSSGAIQFTAGTNNWGGTVAYTLPDELDADGVSVPGVSLPHIYTLVFGTQLKLYVDGDLKVTSASRTGTASTPIDQIGVKNASTEFWKGNLSELAIHPLVLADSEREKYEGYLAHKYGIAAKLPALHTYKTTPPTQGYTRVTASTRWRLTASGLMRVTP